MGQQTKKTLLVDLQGRSLQSGPSAVVQNDAKRDLARHFHALTKLEFEFPQLVQLAFMLANQLTNYVNHKKIKAKDIEFKNIQWHPDGTIRFKVLHKKKPLPPSKFKL